MRIEQLVERVNLGGEAYHFTKKSNIGSIRQQGIRPSSSGFKGIKYSSDSIFVVTKWDEEVFDELMTMLAQKEQGNPVEWSNEQWDALFDSYVIVVINLQKIPDVKFEEDPNSEDYQKFRIYYYQYSSISNISHITL